MNIEEEEEEEVQSRDEGDRENASTANYFYINFLGSTSRCEILSGRRSGQLSHLTIITATTTKWPIVAPDPPQPDPSEAAGADEASRQANKLAGPRHQEQQRRRQTRKK
ncbi:hypothetical protein GWI33_013930 [Rhynchophorus ferrugineus]|uniref:Uncharacterized protein n=1 Tax=Rhynchophorus ferrugineus TaxID=354439 RepID=A0A834MB42_RHYFE|nr:hypothetical protein GWI33_013930 [Rhynchophorus ferrugineus]